MVLIKPSTNWRKYIYRKKERKKERIIWIWNYRSRCEVVAESREGKIMKDKIEIMSVCREKICVFQKDKWQEGHPALYLPSCFEMSPFFVFSFWRPLTFYGFVVGECILWEIDSIDERLEVIREIPSLLRFWIIFMFIFLIDFVVICVWISLNLFSLI